MHLSILCACVICNAYGWWIKKIAEKKCWSRVGMSNDTTMQTRSGSSYQLPGKLELPICLMKILIETRTFRKIGGNEYFFIFHLSIWMVCNWRILPRHRFGRKKIVCIIQKMLNVKEAYLKNKSLKEHWPLLNMT